MSDIVFCKELAVNMKNFLNFIFQITYFESTYIRIAFILA
jgi:hypothetical protein